MRTERAAAVPAESGTLCTFWLGRRCFGLDVVCVGEVVAIEGGVTPVPLARPAVRGVMNLRGTPMPVVDLAEVLGLGAAPGAERATTRAAVIVRDADLAAAALVDRMEAVIPGGRGDFTARQGADEHPAVAGFLDTRAAGGRVVTVLEHRVLLERLNALRYLAATDD